MTAPAVVWADEEYPGMDPFYPGYHDSPAIMDAASRGNIRARRFPLSAILARQEDMAEVLASGRVSRTPDAPVELRIRPDLPGLYELCDGHHRIADKIRKGETHTDADIDLCPDDEPLQGPFWDFAGANVVPARNQTTGNSH